MGPHLGLQYAHGVVLAAALLRPAVSVHFPSVVPSWSQGREYRPHLIYKFYISDISVLYTIWNFIQICPFGLAPHRAFG